MHVREYASLCARVLVHMWQYNGIYVRLWCCMWEYNGIYLRSWRVWDQVWIMAYTASHSPLQLCRTFSLSLLQYGSLDLEFEPSGEWHFWWWLPCHMLVLSLDWYMLEWTWCEQTLASCVTPTLWDHWAEAKTSPLGTRPVNLMTWFIIPPPQPLMRWPIT